MNPFIWTGGAIALLPIVLTTDLGFIAGIVMAVGLFIMAIKI